MTDQQRATICSRCGGLRDRCECAEIRREGMMMAAAFLRDAAGRAGDDPDPEAAGLAATIALRCAEWIDALARKPGPV
jgi:hypothetical protein